LKSAITYDLRSFCEQAKKRIKGNDAKVEPPPLVSSVELKTSRAVFGSRTPRLHPRQQPRAIKQKIKIAQYRRAHNFISPHPKNNSSMRTTQANTSTSFHEKTASHNSRRPLVTDDILTVLRKIFVPASKEEMAREMKEVSRGMAMYPPTVHYG
jgi:hypothetical protein